MPRTAFPAPRAQPHAAPRIRRPDVAAAREAEVARARYLQFMEREYDGPFLQGIGRKVARRPEPGRMSLAIEALRLGAVLAHRVSHPAACGGLRERMLGGSER